MHVDSNCAVDMLLQRAIDVSLFAKNTKDILEKYTKKAIPNSSNFASFYLCRLYVLLLTSEKFRGKKRALKCYC